MQYSQTPEGGVWQRHVCSSAALCGSAHLSVRRNFTQMSRYIYSHKAALITVIFQSAFWKQRTK